MLQRKKNYKKITETLASVILVKFNIEFPSNYLTFYFIWHKQHFSFPLLRKPLSVRDTAFLSLCVEKY